MNGWAIPAAYLFHLYVCDKEEEEETYCTLNKLRKFGRRIVKALCTYFQFNSIRRAQVKVGLINLCKGLFSLNALIYYKLKSGT